MVVNINILVMLLIIASLLESCFSIAKACDKAIFVVAGQSNMAGRGGTDNPSQHWDHYTPPQCRPDPRILRLNNETEWEEAHEPLHKKIFYRYCYGENNRSAGIGPGMAFAEALLKREAAGIRSIGLVPCAVGGTEISLWMPGSCLYKRLLARARASLRDGGELRGMLWYQGESDANKDNADMYEERLKKLFNHVRTDLMSPSLPIIQVALASPYPLTSFVRKIRRLQLKLKLPNVTCVDAKGLQLNSDNLHLTTDSQVKLGSKMAHAFLKHYYLN